jgi:hypothetical protein
MRLAVTVCVSAGRSGRECTDFEERQVRQGSDGIRRSAFVSGRSALRNGNLADPDLADYRQYSCPVERMVEPSTRAGLQGEYRGERTAGARSSRIGLGHAVSASRCDLAESLCALSKRNGPCAVINGTTSSTILWSAIVNALNSIFNQAVYTKFRTLSSLYLFTTPSLRLPLYDSLFTTHSLPLHPFTPCLPRRNAAKAGGAIHIPHIPLLTLNS